jgi:hypothetical protein
VLDNVGEFSVKMRNTNYFTAPSKAYIARVEVIDTEFSTFIIFRDEDKAKPPFRIDNNTNVSLYFNQQGTEIRDLLPPNHSTPFALDDPAGSTKVVVSLESDRSNSYTYNLSKIKPFKPLKVQVIDLFFFFF